MAADDQHEPEPDEVTITRAGRFVAAMQTYQSPSSIEIRLDLWPAEDEQDEVDD